MKNKMKNLAVHRDDCVTCLLFKQMYIADTVVDRQLFFCKSSSKNFIHRNNEKADMRRRHEERSVKNLLNT